MTLRTMVAEDINQLREIHARYYANEFPFPDFSRFLFSLVIVENDQVITGGGLVAVPEAVVITDKSMMPLKKMRALLEFFAEASKRAGALGASQIHAFIQDPKWEQHLRSIGFDTCAGNALYINL